jgi:nitrogenase molybdenum-iron protein NifN
MSCSTCSGTRKPPKAGEEFPSGATNPCKLCTPLGACLAFKGVEGCVPLLHGSQGCATYIRRYCISHYREPIDIASSNFSEDSAVFGGRRNLHLALDNVSRQYRPRVIGIATTCLAETMGEDVPMMLREYENEARELPAREERPYLVNVSTPSFRGTHADGFHDTVRALVTGLALRQDFACPADPAPVAVFPGICSPADLRHLHDLFAWFGLEGTLLPDYSETLDGPSWSDYERLPKGGTPVEAILRLRHAPAALEFGRVLGLAESSAGLSLSEGRGVPLHRLGLPIGLRESDRLVAVLESLSSRPVPRRVALERGRLIDSYVDGHKYLANKRAMIYGEDDLVAGLASFLAETGITPVLCATGSRNGRLREAILAAAPELEGRADFVEGVDFEQMESRITELAPDLLMGSSKGRKLARSLKVPLVECGFPIHDRMGAQRLQLYGYAGTQQLFDRVVNALLERKQEASDIGYSYL